MSMSCGCSRTPPDSSATTLGVVDAAAVPPAARQAVATGLGYSETVFVDLPETGCSTAHAHIYTPATELAFAGHPTVGAG